MTDVPASEAALPTPAQVEAAAVWLIRLRERGGPPVSRAFHAWLDEDAQHPEAFRQAEAVFGALKAPAAAAGWRNLRRQGRSAFAPPLRRRRSGPARIAAAAAGIALLAAAAGPLRDLAVDLAADAHTAKGATAERALADGSVVALNTNTAVRFDLRLGTRRVRLDRGEAYFAVARDPARPFLVEAGDAQVRVLGTHFNVRRDGAGVRVGVEEGHVSVTAHGRIVSLRAGEEAAARADGISVAAVSPQEAALWRTGRLRFERASLAAVAEEVGRYRAGPTLVLGRPARDRRLSAMLDVRAPDAALRTAAETVGAKALALPGGAMLVY